ncbi:hypothetical protein VM1G_08553 [Cytospora mali]|uniref:Heterokaryon incompatibility domain-containing protein n=1 Tax=Cytospora mali TaxID=578113 RepID=A0A194W9A3_CYTMA|nr:hypothetical protein VM1G_08553 [Valsa mali]
MYSSKGTIHPPIMVAESPAVEQLIELRDDIKIDYLRPSQQDWCTTCGWDGSWEHILVRTQFKTAYPPQSYQREIYKSPNITSEEPPLYDRSIGPPTYDEWWTENCARSENELRISASAGNICCAVLLGLKLADSIYNQYEQIYVQHGWVKEAGKRSADMRNWHIFISSEEGPLAPLASIPYLPTGSHPPTDTESSQSLSWAKERIEGCISSHPCSSFDSQTRTLPTRLIDIGESPEVAGVGLRNTSDFPKETQYTALSHCWGDHRPKCITTSNNYDGDYRVIPWADIPKTFRDAILFTQRLNIRYIWIDSICIIQPLDKEDKTPAGIQAKLRTVNDWLHEAVRMSDYYYNASLTLAAVSSANCQGGLFSNRSDRKHYLFNATIGGKHCRFYAFQKSEDIEVFSNMVTVPDGTHHPLLSRCWVYQERLISRRVLCFTEDQLIFNCFCEQTLQDASCYPIDLGYNLKQKYWGLLSSTGGLDDQESFDARLHLSSWWYIIQGYTGLHLTNPTDRLPAFAGIAQQVLSQTRPEDKAGNGYICGARADVLHEDLMWRPCFPRDVRKQDFRHLAPTWSWASYPGGVFNPTDESYKSEVEFVSDSLNFTAAGRFGACIGGYITVKAPAIDCVWKVGLERDDCLSFEQVLILDPSSSSEQSAAFFVPDYRGGYPELEELKDGDEVKVKVIQICRDVIGALVLYQSTKTKHYRRVSTTIKADTKEGRMMKPPYREKIEDVLSYHFGKAERQILSLE